MQECDSASPRARVGQSFDRGGFWAVWERLNLGDMGGLDTDEDGGRKMNECREATISTNTIAASNRSAYTHGTHA